ncbi:uncharacterized protein METZ01_LOCUS318651, partial [marine metagenome]
TITSSVPPCSRTIIRSRPIGGTVSLPPACSSCTARANAPTLWSIESAMRFRP